MFAGIFTTCGINATHRTQCTAGGLGPNPNEWDCLNAGCCYDEWAPQGALSCYAGSAPVSVTFPVSPAAPNTCFNSVDFLGNQQGQTCADANGMVTVQATDRPVYLL